MPKGLDDKPGLCMAIGILIFVSLIATALGRCNRSYQSEARTETSQPLAAIVEIGTISVGSIAQGTLNAGERQAWTLAGTKGQRVAVGAFSVWDNSVAILYPDSERTLTEDGFQVGKVRGS